MNIKIDSFDKNHVCRLCSLVKDKLLPIFDNVGSQFDRKIRQSLPNLDIKQNDHKPQQICLDCVTKLNMCYEFLQHCLHSDAKFESNLQACQLPEKSEENTLKNDSTTFTELNDPLWLNGDPGTKPQEPINVGLQNEGVIVLSKLDSNLNDSSVEDLVVMVELKYKDNTPASNEPSHLLELSPVKPQNPSLEGSTSYETFLSLDAIKDGSIFGLMNNTSNAGSCNIEGKPPETKPQETVKVAKEKLYQCSYCERQFKRRTRLNYHLASHTAIKPHKCDQCDKTFAMKWDLNLHQKVHTRTYACNLCDKVFITKSKLDRHERVHTGEKPFPCTQCGKSFGEKRNLDNHMRTHTGVRPFICAVCNKTFAIRSHMVEHLNIHKKTPPFRCTICNKTFKWRTNYKRHTRLHQAYNQNKFPLNKELV